MFPHWCCAFSGDESHAKVELRTISRERCCTHLWQPTVHQHSRGVVAKTIFTALNIYGRRTKCDRINAVASLYCCIVHYCLPTKPYFSCLCRLPCPTISLCRRRTGIQTSTLVRTTWNPTSTSETAASLALTDRRAPSTSVRLSCW